jgi:hypothetical protein
MLRGCGKQILDFPTIICAGYTCVLHIHSAIEECTFFALKGLIDKKTRKYVQCDADVLACGRASVPMGARHTRTGNPSLNVFPCSGLGCSPGWAPRIPNSASRETL